MSTKVVMVTGLSGSGKSTAARTLEDTGFFCVDNLPVDLVPKLLELTDARGGEQMRLALVIDLRQQRFLSTVLRHPSCLGIIWHVSGNSLP